MAVEHSQRKHALLSASGASRWLNCTPSARLEEKFDGSTSSYAEEGTLAHEFGELNLRLKSGSIEKKTFNSEIKTLRKSKLYGDEMESEVEKYVSYVMETYAAAKVKTPDAVLLIEERLDFSHLVEQGFGTGDSCIVADGTLEIIDLKYGKGVSVDAEENSQLKLYGSGALRAFELMYDIQTVKLTIVQPRLDHISSWEISTEDLIRWGEEVVKPKAEMAYSGEGEQKAGSWCRWCKVKAMCASLAEENIKLAKHEFKDPYLLSDEQLLGVFKQIPMLTDWANSVGEYILAEALKGKKWSGYKLVEGKSRRKWSDDESLLEDVSTVLEKEGFAKKDFTTTELVGITSIEKLVGKNNFNPLLGDFIVIPSGKPTLALESDKRPAMGVEQAKIDFSK